MSEPTRVELSTDQRLQLIECPYCCALILAEKWSKHYDWHLRRRRGR